MSGPGMKLLTGPTIGGITPSGSVAGVPNTTGTVTANSGNIGGVAYQINTGPMQAITAFLPGGGVGQPQASWNIALQASDCPQVGVNYVFTIYSGDGNGLSMRSTNFMRTS